MSIGIVAVSIAIITIFVAAYLSWSTEKVLKDVKQLLLEAQVHNQALGHSIDQLTAYTMRAGPPTVNPLPFTSYDEYVIKVIQRMGQVEKVMAEIRDSSNGS